MRSFVAMGTVTQRWVTRLRNKGETLIFRTLQWTSVHLGRFTPRVQTRIVRVVQLALEVHVKSAADEVSVNAAALTYNCFLSMLPLAMVGLSAASFFKEPDPSGWTGRLFETIPGLAPLVQEKFESLQSTRTSLGVIGLIGALWVGSTLASRAQRALDKIFGGRQNFVVNRVRGIGVTIVLGALVIVSLGLSSFVSRLSADGLIAIPVYIAIRVVLVVVMFAYWLLAYRLLTPTHGIRIRDHLTGAVWMTLGFEVLRLVGGLYVGNFIAKTTALYGAIGAVFGLLLFIRLSMWLFLYGAEVSSIVRKAIPWSSLKADLRGHRLESLDAQGDEVVEG
jgi:membrane protein